MAYLHDELIISHIENEDSMYATIQNWLWKCYIKWNEPVTKVTYCVNTRVIHGISKGKISMETEVD